MSNMLIFGAKKGHGGVHGPPAPPPTNPPDPPVPGDGSPLDFTANGKYIPSGHPYTDRVPLSVLPLTFHTQEDFDTDGVAVGAYVDVVLVNSGNRATNTTLMQSAIDTNRVLNQNTRILLPNTFPMYAFACKEITNAGKWIKITRSSAPAAVGLRANPVNMATAPECMSPAQEEPAIYFWRKASRYYIRGIKFVPNPALTHTYNLIHLSPREASVEYDTDVLNINDQVIFDQCLVQGGDAGTGAFTFGVRNGVLLNGKRSAFINGYIHQISELGREAHGISITNTTGPVKVVNNFIEATAIGSLIGGDTPHYGLVTGRPRDIEWRRNFHTKRLSWAPTSSTWDGVSGRGGKGLFETKNVLRILLEGNVLDGCWADGQAGMILVLKSALANIPGQPATGQGSESVTLRYNILRNSVRPWNFQGLDDPTAEYMRKIVAYDNLLYNMGTFVNQTEGKQLITHRIDDGYIRHNTLVHNEFTAGLLNFDYPFSPRSQNFVFSDNVESTGSPDYGMFMTGGAIGAAALNAWAENPYCERNIFIGPYGNSIANSLRFNTNTVATNVAAMNFRNLASNDYHLTTTSPGKGLGINGKDLGADIDKVNLATSGVATTVASTPCSVITHTNPIALTMPPKPSYLQTIIDPDFGTQIMRITGDNGVAIPTVGGTWSDGDTHHYAKDQPWSADGRLIFLSRVPNASGGNYLFLDGDPPYPPLFTRFSRGSESRWHPTLADVMIIVNADGTGAHWNVRTNTVTPKVTFSGYNSAVMGPSEGNPSYDGQYVVAVATRASDSKRVAYFMNLNTAQKGADIDISALSIDWASVSAGGAYIVVHLADRSQRVYDRATGALVNTFTDILIGHFDLGIDVNGNEVIFGLVGSASHGKIYITRRLDTGAIVDETPVTTFNGHASCRMLLRQGWGTGVNNDAGGAFDREIFAARLAAVQSIERYCHHRSVVTDYIAEPHAVPDRSGKRFMFASNWGAASGRPVHTFICDIRNICP